jgi:hypothetical protein
MNKKSPSNLSQLRSKCHHRQLLQCGTGCTLIQCREFSSTMTTLLVTIIELDENIRGSLAIPSSLFIMRARRKCSLPFAASTHSWGGGSARLGLVRVGARGLKVRLGLARTSLRLFQRPPVACNIVLSSRFCASNSGAWRRCSCVHALIAPCVSIAMDANFHQLDRI